MFGYIRPLSENLKVKEFYRFKACYCGLCSSLRKNYGFSSGFILNYDFVFLAMLLWEDGSGVEYEFKRCAASVCRKKCMCKSNAALDECAAKSIILAYWKLIDDCKDEKLFKRCAATLGKLIIGNAYKNAVKAYPTFDSDVSKCLAELDTIEKTGEATLDETADKFARLLSGLADGVKDETKKRILEQIFYHTGRFIYVIDAVDDLKRDMEESRYNPVAKRFGLKDSCLSDEQENLLRTTLGNSFHIIRTDFELLPATKWTEILENIICDGMPDVCDKVFKGTFQNSKPKMRDLKKLNAGVINE